MTTILIIVGISCILANIGKSIKTKRMAKEIAAQKAQQKAHAAFIKEQERINQEAFRERLALRKEQERQAKEQERQAKELARHDEMLLRMDNRLAVIEGEIAHNREIVDRIANLIKLEEAEQSKCTKDSPEWAKHEKKIVSLMNQQYNAQKKITKAKGDRRVCEQKISA